MPNNRKPDGEAGEWPGIVYLVRIDPGTLDAGQYFTKASHDRDVVAEPSQSCDRFLEQSSTIGEKQFSLVDAETTALAPGDDHDADWRGHFGRRASYCSAVKSEATCDGSDISTSIIHPSPYGSWLTSSGRSMSFSFTSTTVPLTGAKRSEAVLTDSTTPNVFPCSTRVPTFGSSTNTTSPSCS